ncbi:MOSC domain-containing protein [Sporosarcina sp. 179-K 3D1 HS]|uniref:MOSC domain-containing protein n=1 Tax=Sporosarcina sp. 179-K 3D1 HS TaxID=3232169 RepID=UPI00399F1DAE
MNNSLRIEWRYPVKSIMGEVVNVCEITEMGLRGDRAYGVVDMETGRLANAKNPKKWPGMFQYRATFVEPVEGGSRPLPPVRITLPNGETVVSNESHLNERLTNSFNRSVRLASPSSFGIEFEVYIPEGIEELENPGTVFSRPSPEETFFDISTVHLITTSTIDTLRSLAPDSRIEPRRFRPNLILEVPNAEGFIEQQWVGKTLIIGDQVQLKITQPTKRCVMTTLAQGDLPNDPEVLRTLVKKNEGSFGVYAEVLRPGTVQVNDVVSIHE